MWKVLLITYVACLVVVLSSDNSQATSLARRSSYRCLCDKLAPGYCKKRCVCASGYLRVSKRTCVPRNQCDKNSQATSSARRSGYRCLCDKLAPGHCKKRCVCASGYLRVSKRTCVPRNQYDKTAGPNEFYDTCISGCSNQNCDSIGKSYSCPIQPAVCRTGCRCQRGFYRNARDVCVPESECPSQCGQNELPSNCSNGGCGPFKCSDLGYPIVCVRPQECQKGCVCQDTYVRSENGTCVSKDQCTGSCRGDPNAKPGCGVNCGRTCTSYKIKSPFCPQVCAVNGCDCKEDFVFDSNLRKCVLKEDCTPTCGINETYRPSEGKCVCQKEYARISNGTCVPKS